MQRVDQPPSGPAPSRQLAVTVHAMDTALQQARPVHYFQIDRRLEAGADGLREPEVPSINVKRRLTLPR